MKTLGLAIAAAATCLIPLGAAQAQTPCVWLHNLDDFKPAKDEKSVMIAESMMHKYNVTLMGRCIGLRFAETIAVKSVGGMFCLQPGDSISFGYGGTRQRCMIDKIEPYTPPPAGGDHASDSHADQPAPSGY